MTPINFNSFTKELEKIAVDTGTLAAMIAGGKIIGANFLHRYGHNIPGIRHLGQGIAGIGLRTGMQGKPMLHPAVRAIGGVLGDPSLMSAYENAHRLGKTLGSNGIAQAKQMIPIAQKAGLHVDSKLIDGIRTDSTGIRKIMDYGFTPVSQVAKDAKGGLKKLKSKLLPSKAPSSASAF